MTGPGNHATISRLDAPLPPSSIWRRFQSSIGRCTPFSPSMQGSMWRSYATTCVWRRRGRGEIGRHYKLPMVLLFQRLLLLLLMDEEEAPGKTPLLLPPVVGTVGRSQRVKEKEKTRGGGRGGRKRDRDISRISFRLKRKKSC